MPLRSSLLALLLLLATSASAQTPPSPACALGTAAAELSAAGARATLATTGQLFEFSSGYEVPKGSGISPIYSTSLMVGGLVGGEVRFAGSAYGPAEYWPGPLAADGTTTPAQCAAYDRIWVVGTADLAAYDATGTASADLADWPVRVGAPFYVDGNGNGQQDGTEPTVSLDPGDPGYGTRAINLGAGERPVVFGRQTAWWVMNDAGGPHEWSANDGEAFRQPIGLEVRATAWVHGGDAEPGLAQSTFYRFEVVNRSAAPLATAHAGLYADADLGAFNDDRVGTDSTRQMLVFYNGDDFDEGGYGDRPPALGVDALSGAWAAPTPVKSAGPAHGEPFGALRGYNYLRGLWGDGTPVRVGGFGVGTDGPVTRWLFSGDVVTRSFWSQENLDGAGATYVPSDKKGMLSSLPADLAPGERMVLDVAILFATGGSRLDSVTELRAVSDRAQSLYDAGALTAPVADPAAPPAPSPVAPAEAATVEGDAVTFAWDAIAGAELYVLEVLASAEGEPILTWASRTASAEVPRARLPLNRRDPLLWRVRAVRFGVEGEPSALRAFTYFVPGVDRFSVVANAAGPLAEPVVFQNRWTWAPEAQADGGRWALVFEDAPVGAAAAAAYPNDYEIRFVVSASGPAEAVRVSDGARVTVPFELWDIGVGTPGDRSDDVRLIPVVHDVDADGTPPRETTFAWYRPERMVPGERGYRAWAQAAALPEAARQVLPPTYFESHFGTSADWPERGTIVRLESSAQALAVATPTAGEALAVEVRPNPMATRATVAYRLTEPGPVRLTLVDVLGREVAVLAEGDRAEGEHRAALDATEVAPGVYVVVLRAGGAQAVRTLTVAR